MAERIGLEAVLEMGQFNKGLSGYQSGINLMGNVTGSVVNTISGLLSSATQAIGSFGGSVVSEGMAYTSAMSNVQAVSGAVGDEFAALQAQAENLGATTKFTATEAAEGMGFLAMAGFEVDKIIGAMPATLNLASAANLDLGKSADIASNIMSGMGVDASNLEGAADALVRTFTSSNTSLRQLGDSFKQVAPKARDLGFDVEATSAALGILADSGVQGFKSGTDLNSLLVRLSAPTKKAAATMKELEINTFDTATGAFLPLADIVEQFQDKLGGMTDQQRSATLGMIFNQKQANTLSLLMNGVKGEFEAGADSLRNYEDQLRSGTTAAEVAATQIDNLSGDVTLFQSAVSGVQISIFKELEPILRALVQAGTALIGVIGPPLQSAFAAISPIISNVINSITNLITGFSGAANQAQGWGYNIAVFFANGIASGIGLITNVMNSISNMLASWLAPGSPPRVAPNIDKWGASTMDEWLGGFDNADFSTFNALSDEIEKALQGAVDAGDMDQEALIPALLGSRDAVAAALDELNQTGTVSDETFQNVVDAAGPAGDAVKGLLNSYLGLQQASQGVEDAQANLDKSLSDVESAYDQLANASTDAEEQAALKAIETAEANRLQARTQLESAEAAEAAAKIKVANEEKIRRIQEENAKLLAEQQKLLDKNNESASDDAAAKEAERRAKAERDYRFGIANTAGKIGILQDELANAEKGSVEYYDILGQLHRLEEQRLSDEARANENLAGSAGGGGGGSVSGSPSLGGLDGGGVGEALELTDMIDIDSLEVAGSLAGDALGAGFESAEGAIGDVFDNLESNAGGFQNSIFDISNAMSQTRDNVISSVAPITEAFTRFKDNVVGFATEIFDAYSEGGIPVVLETLGITPAAIELATKIKDTLTEITTTILGVAIEAVTAAASFDWLGALNTTIEFVNENFEAIKGALIGIGVAIAGIGIVAIIASIVAAFNPLTLIIGAVIAVAALLGAAWATNFMGIRDITNQVMSVVSAVISSVWEIITTSIVPSLQMAFDNITAALNSLGLNWSDIWNGISMAIGIVAGTIGVIILGIIGVVTSMAAGIAAEIAAATAHFQAFLTDVQTIITGIAQVFTGFWDMVVGLFTGNTEQITEGFTLWTEGLWNIVDGLSTSVQEVFTGMFDAVVAGVGTFIESMTGFFTDLYMSIVGGSIVPDMINGIIEWFGRLGGPVLETVRELIGTVGDLFSSITDWFGGSGTELNVDTQAMIEDFTVTLPEAVQAFTELVAQAFNIMSEATLQYGTFLQDVLVAAAIPAATKGHQSMGSSVSSVWARLAGLASAYMSIVVMLTTTSIPAMAKAFVNAGKTISSTATTINESVGSIKTRIQADAPDINAAFQTIITKIGEVPGATGPAVSAISSFKSTVDGISTNKIDNVKSAFDRVESAVKSAIQALRDFNNQVDETKTPPDLTPGSPTPFEVGLMGVNRQLELAANNLANLTRVQTPAASAFTRPQQTINNVTNESRGDVTINLTVDSNQRLQQVKTLIQREVSGGLA